MPTPHDTDADVLIIGAGPAGAAAAAWLAREGYRVRVLERDHFPRFCLGESLLPACMQDLAGAGLLDSVQRGGYQAKNGAAFRWREREATIDFRDRQGPGWRHTYQVERADFDQRLIRVATRRGAEVEFGVTVTAVHPDARRPRLTRIDEHGRPRTLTARFLLDASGPGRVIARARGLARPPRLAPRQALFSHVDDGIRDPAYDRDKILIAIHPREAGIWYWLIPFRGGRASLGVVGDPAALARHGDTPEARWQALLDAEPCLRDLLRDARRRRPLGELQGYATAASRLHGPGYAVLGNAGEFLDPVFSSGVTIALHSALLAAPLVARRLDGEAVDWAAAFETPLRRGIATFRAFVEAWYDGRLPAIIFHPRQPATLRRQISAVLAGYAWDRDNPFVRAPHRHLTALARHCGQRAPAGSPP
ncbi:NAD(P)/FAD-dependent oxidoreductase [Halomonas nitroreducens]|uniref:NAD(P)/FAD-dependent oxidoreductase n=1 Tax=Halomonas nitroreducens TaxID=447425 RepID=A0A3S0HSU6_9GAMM|nr:NAD(P)/FAD-dependent oxidoreductase [Halomonas nitroreducens]RTR07120.1 NAD(P)/FAD-dependent oxidoreductase [Halomonas nitroreducens]